MPLVNEDRRLVIRHPHVCLELPKPYWHLDAQCHLEQRTGHVDPAGNGQGNAPENLGLISTTGSAADHPALDVDRSSKPSYRTRRHTPVRIVPSRTQFAAIDHAKHDDHPLARNDGQRLPREVAQHIERKVRVVQIRWKTVDAWLDDKLQSTLGAAA